MIRGRLARVDDIDLPTSVPQALRDFYAQWLIELSAPAPYSPLPWTPTTDQPSSSADPAAPAPPCR